MDEDTKRDLKVVGIGAAGGTIVGSGSAIDPFVESWALSRKRADTIVDHLKAHGITNKDRVAIVGLPASGKSSIARALKAEGFNHVPLDRMHRGGQTTRFAKKGIPPGTLVDHTLALKKTGGGQYDAVIRTHYPGREETRRRLVKRGSGIRMYNKVDYDKLNDEIEADFNKLHGHKIVDSKANATIAITKHHKAINDINLPIVGSGGVWERVHYRRENRPLNPIGKMEVYKGRPEFRGALGALGGAAVVGGVLAARKFVDKRQRNMSSRIESLINLNSRLDDIIEFRTYIDEDDHTVRNVAGGAAAGLGVGAGAVGAYAGHRAILSKYGTRLALPQGQPGPVQPGAAGFQINPVSPTGTLASEVSTGGAYKAAAKDIGSNLTQRFTGAKTVGKQAYQTVLRRGEGSAAALWAAAKKAGKYFVG